MSDRIQVELVDTIDRTDAPVFTVTPQQIAGQCDDLANGLVNAKHQPKPVTMRFTSGITLNFDPWKFFEGLGRIARAKRRHDTSERDLLFHRLPSAQSVIALLEERRRKAFRTLQGLYHSPEELMRRMSETLDRTVEQFAAEGLTAIPCHIWVRDLLILYARTRYKLLPSPDLGWRRGVHVEMSLMARRMPNRTSWTERARAICARFQVPLGADEDAGGYAQQTAGSVTGTGATAASEEGSLKEARLDESRLLFHMAHPKYRELRSLRGDNPYGYCVAVFDGGKFVVDTDRVGNALFCLQGPEGECLQTATGTKSEIRSSPHFAHRIIHDAHGQWRTAETEWLDKP